MDRAVPWISSFFYEVVVFAEKMITIIWQALIDFIFNPIDSGNVETNLIILIPVFAFLFVLAVKGIRSLITGV